MSHAPLEKLKVNSEFQHSKSAHLRKIDKEIRKKWKEIYYYRKGRIPTINPEQPNSLIRQRTEMMGTSIFRCNVDAYKIQSIKAGLIREKTQEHIKKSEEIFYRKKSQEVPRRKDGGLLLQRMSCELPRKDSSPPVKKNGNNEEYSQQKLPFMLRRRRNVLDKQIGIIDQQYERSLQRIKSKQDFKKSANYDDKLRLLNKMKGTKVYYKFIRPTSLPGMDRYEED